MKTGPGTPQGKTSVTVEIVALIRIIPGHSKSDNLTSLLGDFSLSRGQYHKMVMSLGSGVEMPGCSSLPCSTSIFERLLCVPGTVFASVMTLNKFFNLPKPWFPNL